MEEGVVDIGHADQSHGRAVRQRDRGVAMTLVRGGDNLLGRLRILADEGDRVTTGVAEAKHRVVATGSALADQIGAAAGVDRIIAGPPVDCVGTAAAGNQGHRYRGRQLFGRSAAETRARL